MLARGYHSTSSFASNYHKFSHSLLCIRCVITLYPYKIKLVLTEGKSIFVSKDSICCPWEVVVSRRKYSVSRRSCTIQSNDHWSPNPVQKNSSSSGLHKSFAGGPHRLTTGKKIRIPPRHTYRSERVESVKNFKFQVF